MKRGILVILLLYSLKAIAQNYQINFTATGGSTNVNSVKVENLNQGTFLTLNGSDILNLAISTGINSTLYDQQSELKIYPNPMTDFSTLEIYPPVSGDAVISVINIAGKSLVQLKSHFDNQSQDFRLSGLETGLYVVNVEGKNYKFSGKLVSNGRADGKISIEKVNSIIRPVDEKTLERDSKGISATVNMVYTAGDRLKFTGNSGNYSTVLTDIPASSKAINFNFLACTDVDNINYPVVVIGNQVWMAENLKTTKYNDGTVIPNVTLAATWAALTTGAYCDINNASSNSTTYGRLYNWYVVEPTNAKKVCPTGWHVPSDAEWTTLTTFLGGEYVAGGNLKETGTTHWLSPNTGAKNGTGFTAVPGGFRYLNGAFYDFGDFGSCWSATEYDASNAWAKYVTYNSIYVYRNYFEKYGGFSVRCIKD